VLRFEAAFADDVDRAAKAAGGEIGRQHLGDLDPRDIGERHVEQRLRAAGVARGDLGAVELHAGVVRGEAAQRQVARGEAGVVDGDAGQETHELADILVAHVAVGVDRDDVLDVRGGAPLVERDRLRAHLAILDDREGIEFHRLAQGGGPARALEHEVEFTADRAAGQDADRGLLRHHAHIGNAESHVARRHADEPVRTAFIGNRLTSGALERHAGVAERGARRGVEHAAFNHARSRLGPEVAGRGNRRQNHERHPPGRDALHKAMESERGPHGRGQTG
jgi:hypothetical protein